MGSASRILSNSNRLWEPIEKCNSPAPTTYFVDREQNRSYLKSKLGVTIRSIQILKDKMKTKDTLPIEKRKELELELAANFELLNDKVRQLKQALAEDEKANSLHKRQYMEPRRAAFTSSSKRFYEEQAKIKESPHFYTSPAQWDFGAETRSHIMKTCF